MTNYVNPYTGQTISPSQVSYESLTISQDTILQWPVNSNSDVVAANIVSVTATLASLKVIMPPATQVSTGQAIIIRNSGTNVFSVTDYSGNTIASVAAGVSLYIYITDNSTVNGVWTSLTLGAGTSAANAADLAGLGLKAIGSTLNSSTPISLLAANYTFTTSDRASMYVWTGGAGTLTLASSATLGSGWYAIIKNDGTGILTINASGSDLIDGNSTAQLQLSESFVIACNGTGFYTYAYGRSTQFAFTQLSKSITGGTLVLTSSEAQNIIQQYIGTLTSNANVILPSTVQLYSIRNATSGAYTVTFKTSSSSGLTVAVPQNQTLILVCDGTNVYNTQSGGGGSTNQVQLIDGTSASPSLSFLSNLNTGLYLSASGQLGFTLNGNNAMTLKTSGLQVPVGINAGSF